MGAKVSIFWKTYIIVGNMFLTTLKIGVSNIYLTNKQLLVVVE